MNSIVKIHCGSAHVKGSARNYRYYVASLFSVRQTLSGKYIYYNTGKTVGLFRSENKTIKYGMELAKKCGAEFISGYGSLHNVKVD